MVIGTTTHSIVAEGIIQYLDLAFGQLLSRLPTAYRLLTRSNSGFNDTIGSYQQSNIPTTTHSPLQDSICSSEQPCSLLLSSLETVNS